MGFKEEQRTKTGQFELSKNDLVYKVFYFRLKRIAKKSFYAIDRVRKKVDIYLLKSETLKRKHDRQFGANLRNILHGNYK